MNQNKKNKGKILRVKTGYNPNSSSIGSGVPPFLFFAIGSGALTVFILNILNFADKKLRKGKNQKTGNSEKSS